MRYHIKFVKCMMVVVRLNFAHLYSNIIYHRHDLNAGVYTRGQQNYMVSKTKRAN